MSQENSQRETLNKVKEAILRSQQSVAGREAIFLILRAFFENKLDADAKILVVGAGWGEEILCLGKPNPEWQFIGVDLSEEMLNLARLNIATEILPNKVELYQTDVGNLDDEDFDAATCILTLHFVPDDGAKLALLRAVRKRLKPGAPFYLVDGVRETDEAEYQEDVQAWKRHAVNNGMPVEMIDKFVENSMSLPIVTEQRELELLQEAGFAKTRKVYQGIHICGWLSVRG